VGICPRKPAANILLGNGMRERRGRGGEGSGYIEEGEEASD